MKTEDAIKTITKESLWVFLGKFSYKVFFILVQIIIARYLGASAYGAIIPEHIDQYKRSGYSQSEAFSKARLSAILPALSEGVASYLLNGIVKKMPDEFDTKANINNLSLNDIAIIDKTYGWKKFLKEVSPKQGVRETVKALEVSSDDLSKTFSKRAISSSAARKEWVKRNYKKN